jgi:hypothetical protein
LDAIAFLYEGYRLSPLTLYAEIADVYRRLILCGLIVFMGNTAVVRSLYGSLLAAAWIQLFSIYLPYMSKRLNSLAHACNIVVLSTFLMSFFIADQPVNTEAMGFGWIIFMMNMAIFGMLIFQQIMEKVNLEKEKKRLTIVSRNSKFSQEDDGRDSRDSYGTGGFMVGDDVELANMGGRSSGGGGRYSANSPRKSSQNNNSKNINGLGEEKDDQEFSIEHVNQMVTKDNSNHGTDPTSATFERNSVNTNGSRGSSGNVVATDRASSYTSKDLVGLKKKNSEKKQVGFAGAAPPPPPVQFSSSEINTVEDSI